MVIAGICIQWTGVLDWSAGLEYWNGITGMESLEWSILDRVSSRAHGSHGRKAMMRGG